MPARANSTRSLNTEESKFNWNHLVDECGGYNFIENAFRQYKFLDKTVLEAAFLRGPRREVMIRGAPNTVRTVKKVEESELLITGSESRKKLSEIVTSFEEASRGGMFPVKDSVVLLEALKDRALDTVRTVIEEGQLFVYQSLDDAKYLAVVIKVCDCIIDCLFFDGVMEGKNMSFRFSDKPHKNVILVAGCTAMQPLKRDFIISEIISSTISDCVKAYKKSRRMKYKKVNLTLMPECLFRIPLLVQNCELYKGDNVEFLNVRREEFPDRYALASSPHFVAATVESQEGKIVRVKIVDGDTEVMQSIHLWEGLLYPVGTAEKLGVEIKGTKGGNGTRDLSDVGGPEKIEDKDAFRGYAELLMEEDESPLVRPIAIRNVHEGRLAEFVFIDSIETGSLLIPLSNPRLLPAGFAKRTKKIPVKFNQQRMNQALVSCVFNEDRKERMEIVRRDEDDSMDGGDSSMRSESDDREEETSPLSHSPQMDDIDANSNLRNETSGEMNDLADEMNGMERPFEGSRDEHKISVPAIPLMEETIDGSGSTVHSDDSLTLTTDGEMINTEEIGEIDEEMRSEEDEEEMEIEKDEESTIDNTVIQEELDAAAELEKEIELANEEIEQWAMKYEGRRDEENRTRFLSGDSFDLDKVKKELDDSSPISQPVSDFVEDDTQSKCDHAPSSSIPPPSHSSIDPSSTQPSHHVTHSIQSTSSPSMQQSLLPPISAACDACAAVSLPAASPAEPLHEASSAAYAVVSAAVESAADPHLAASAAGSSPAAYAAISPAASAVDFPAADFPPAPSSAADSLSAASAGVSPPAASSTLTPPPSLSESTEVDQLNPCEEHESEESLDAVNLSPLKILPIGSRDDVTRPTTPVSVEEKEESVEKERMEYTRPTYSILLTLIENGRKSEEKEDEEIGKMFTHASSSISSVDDANINKQSMSTRGEIVETPNKKMKGSPSMDELPAKRARIDDEDGEKIKKKGTRGIPLDPSFDSRVLPPEILRAIGGKEKEVERRRGGIPRHPPLSLRSSSIEDVRLISGAEELKRIQMEETLIRLGLMTSEKVIDHDIITAELMSNFRNPQEWNAIELQQFMEAMDIKQPLKDHIREQDFDGMKLFSLKFEEILGEFPFLGEEEFSEKLFFFGFVDRIRKLINTPTMVFAY
ncbi:hypothetical protein PFISCL1PPCAC_14806 [Pristionchus fissidentatus]|uniref:Uncharacterized protein n=1 Tax=Pristionchus fissidentatus TaxID=1538716 RepID=A0AAV5VVD2_9BILA|nr:hypothetical protein PFISCL1PPCAC_14806 [Pristionchus fissidentatus]